MAEDFGLSFKISADSSDIDKVQQKVDAAKEKLEKPPKPVTVDVKPPEPVVVKVSQDPDPLKIRVAQPDPSEIQSAFKTEDFHVDVQPKLDPSELQAIPPIKVPVEPNPNPLKPKVEPPDAGGFNALRAVTAVLHGNLAALGMEIAKIGTNASTAKKIGVAGFGAIGASITSVIMLARSLRDLFATLFNAGAVGKDISGIGASLIDIRNKANEFAEAMNDARKAADLVNSSLENEIAALGRVAKAQNEINRQRELAAAKGDDERDAINTKYDRQAIDVESGTAQQTAELKRKAIVDEIARIEQEITESKKLQTDYEAKAAAARSRANLERPTNALTATAEGIVSSFTGKATSEEKSLAASNVATQAMNSADDEAERRAELEEKLEKARHDLKIADLESEARKREESAAREKNQTDEVTKKNEESEKKAKENAEKDKKQHEDQTYFERQQKRAAADAEFDQRFREAQRRTEAPDATKAQRREAENAQVEMLRDRQRQAESEIAEAKKRLSEELKKPVDKRDENVLSRAREDIRAAESTATEASRRREDIEASIRNRRIKDSHDYFGNLANQIDAGRPKNRLTAMGLGSGGVAVDRTAQEQASNVKLLVQLAKEQLAATKANKPAKGYATFAP